MCVCVCVCFINEMPLIWYPSSSAYPRPGRGGSSLSRDAQTSLSLDTLSCSSGGIPRCSQANRETQSLQRVLGLPRGLFPVGRARNTSPGRHPGGIRCPSHLSWLLSMEQRLYSELLPSHRAPHPIFKGAPSHPMEKSHFGHLYPGSCPFGHDPVSAPSPRQTGTSTALLQKLHRSVCQSPVPSFPHSWTRPQDT